MRKIFPLFLLLMAAFVFPNTGWAAELLEIQAKSYFLFEPQSGIVLAEKNADQPLPPASMTKVMSELIILEKIKNGEHTWDEMVTTSPRAAKIEEAQIHLKPGEKETLRELFIAMAVYSANDATVALAEHVGGSEEQFVALMNQKAKQIGLTNTHFINSTGLGMHSYPDPPKVSGEHVMSAKDTARLTWYLLHHYPEIKKIATLTKYTFHKDSPSEQKIENWNWMLPGLKYEYMGMTGLKTGNTDAAGYCFTGSVVRNHFHMVGVVMGTESQSARFMEMTRLFDYGYQTYSLQTFLTPDQPVPNHATLPLTNGVERTVPIGIKEPIRIPIQSNQQEHYSYLVKTKEDIQAPLSQGTVVGTVEVLYQGEKIPGITPIPLITQKDIKKASWFRLLMRGVSDKLKSWGN